MAHPSKPAAGVVLPSPIGRFQFEFGSDGRLTRIDLPGRHRRARSWGELPPGAPSARVLERWLRGFLSGADAPFPGPWAVPGATHFTRRVYRCVARIPPGTTRTYQQVARAAGSPRAMRAVGNAMANNPLPLVIPCHRVVARDGLGGFGGGLPLKIELLRREGAPAESGC